MLPSEPAWLPVVIIAGGAVFALLCELAIVWASTALIDAEVEPRLFLFTLVAGLVSAGVAYAIKAPLDSALPETFTKIEGGKFPWGLAFVYAGVVLGCSLLAFGLLSWPMLGTGAKRSVLVGVFSTLLRVLLYSVVACVLFVILASVQISQPGKQATPQASAAR